MGVLGVRRRLLQAKEAVEMEFPGSSSLALLGHAALSESSVPQTLWTPWGNRSFIVTGKGLYIVWLISSPGWSFWYDLIYFQILFIAINSCWVYISRCAARGWLFACVSKIQDFSFLAHVLKWSKSGYGCCLTEGAIHSWLGTTELIFSPAQSNSEQSAYLPCPLPLSPHWHLLLLWASQSEEKLSKYHQPVLLPSDS